MVTARRDGQVALVTARVGGVGALVVLDVARADKGVLERRERRVAVDGEGLSTGAGVRDGGRGHAAERAGEGLEVAAGCGARARRGGRGSGLLMTSAVVGKVSE